MYVMIRLKFKVVLSVLGICYICGMFRAMYSPSNSGINPPLHTDEVINPHPYDFTIANYNHCWNGTSTAWQPFLLILVKTGPDSFYDRQQVRRTWGGMQTVSGKLTITVFLLGLSENPEVNKRVRQESELYSDIVQENFIDSYRNLTIKNMMGLKWAGTFCPNVSYVVSADADILLNTVNLVNRLVDKPRQRYAEGALRSHVRPVRSDKRESLKKWYTPVELYPKPTYAPFFPGSCYVMSADVASLVYLESKHVRFLPWDDVFVGLVMKRIGIQPTYGRGFGQYVKLTSNISIIVTLAKGIGVLIHHQENQIDERLVELWQSAIEMSKHQTHMYFKGHMSGIITVVIVLLIFMLSIICVCFYLLLS